VRWFGDKPAPKIRTQFPFVTEFGGKRITVTGLHYSGRAYETNGYGLIPLYCVPVEVAQEAYPAYAESTRIEPERKKPWRKTGFFNGGPNAAKYAAVARNNKTCIYREWLEITLREPRPAAEVFKLAAADGIPVKGLKRAKKHHKVISVRVDGAAWRGSWVWRFPAD
jgi:hypothetical protein